MSNQIKITGDYKHMLFPGSMIMLNSEHGRVTVLANECERSEAGGADCSVVCPKELEQQVKAKIEKIGYQVKQTWTDDEGLMIGFRLPHHKKQPDIGVTRNAACVLAEALVREW